MEHVLCNNGWAVDYISPTTFALTLGHEKSCLAHTPSYPASPTGLHTRSPPSQCSTGCLSCSPPPPTTVPPGPLSLVCIGSPACFSPLCPLLQSTSLSPSGSSIIMAYNDRGQDLPCSLGLCRPALSPSPLPHSTTLPVFLIRAIRKPSTTHSHSFYESCCFCLQSSSLTRPYVFFPDLDELVYHMSSPYFL